ncbi:MAG: SUMF1/EgtB/PvdO family nonheme iron enzyme [Saprospiraceae bacterium]|nr:SUMF1/EgtB/PvdO family nonheme iron enzyme [Saprospiraceae bacterium]
MLCRSLLLQNMLMRKHFEKTYFCVCKVNHHRASNRVNRGGSWNNDARNCRAANRNNNTPTNRNNNVGFRLAL